MNIKETLQFIFNSFKFWFIVNPWEDGIRVRFGRFQTLCKAGLYFRIPHFDKIFLEETRLRVISMPLQSVTTKDNLTLTVKCGIGYRIVDVMKMYNTIHQPEMTITNIVMDKIVSFLISAESSVFNESELKDSVLEELRKSDFGIEFDYIKILSACQVRTYRLIMDQHWDEENLEMKEIV